MLAKRQRRSCQVRHFLGKDLVQEAVELFRRKRHSAAGNLRTVLALRNKHRTVPRALPLLHFYRLRNDRQMIRFVIKTKKKDIKEKGSWVKKRA